MRHETFVQIELNEYKKTLLLLLLLLFEKIGGVGFAQILEVPKLEDLLTCSGLVFKGSEDKDRERHNFRCTFFI